MVCHPRTATRQVLHTSSTGVYGDQGGDNVDEETEPAPASECGEQLILAERVAPEETTAAGIDGTVARLASIDPPGTGWSDTSIDRWLKRHQNTAHRDDAAGTVAPAHRGGARGE